MQNQFGLKRRIGEPFCEIEIQRSVEVGGPQQQQCPVGVLEDTDDVLLEHARKVAAVLDRAEYQPVALYRQMEGKAYTDCGNHCRGEIGCRLLPRSQSVA